MSKKFTDKQVKHIADLVKLQLTDKELQQFKKEMEETLEYIHNLSQLDTENISPTSQTTGLKNRFLKEKPNERALKTTDVFKNTTSVKNNYFQIKSLEYAK